MAAYLTTVMTNLMSSENSPTWLWASVVTFEVVFIPPTLLILVTNIAVWLLFTSVVCITMLVYAGMTEEGRTMLAFYNIAKWYLHFYPLILLLGLPASKTAPAMVWNDKTAKWEAVGVMLHVLMSFVLFFALLYFHDPSQTSKPEWLEWLG